MSEHIKITTKFEKASFQYSLFEHQKLAAKAILLAQKRGFSDFLLADKTGLGKTLSALSGVTVCSKARGFNKRKRAKVLIVCPNGALEVWRQTVRNFYMSIDYCQIAITNYEQLYKLLEVPPESKRAKKATTKRRNRAKFGKPIHNWDYIIFDESHKLKKYPDSQISNAAANVAKLNEPYVEGKSPFVIFVTATPGVSLMDFSIMARLFGPLIAPGTKAGKNVTPRTWPVFLMKQGFHMSKTKSGIKWVSEPWFGKNSSNPDVRAEYQKKLESVRRQKLQDVNRIKEARRRKEAPILARSPSQLKNWPEQQIVMYPIELTPKQKPLYEKAWSAFREFLMMPRTKKDSQAAIVQALRYSQKSSILKVDSLSDFISERIADGCQIYISCQFLETLDKYEKLLDSKKIPYSELSGRNKEDKEKERVRFQKGETKVALCTVTESLSLHANEQLADGTKATPNERISLIHDVRRNPLDAEQSFGRAHRNGENSVIYIPYFVDTPDEKILAKHVFNRGNMKTMLGEDDAWDLMEEYEEVTEAFKDVIED